MWCICSVLQRWPLLQTCHGGKNENKAVSKWRPQFPAIFRTFLFWQFHIMHSTIRCGKETLYEISELDKTRAYCSAEYGPKPAFALQRPAVLSYCNLCSPESGELGELRGSCHLTCAVPHRFACFMPPGGDFML